MQRSLLSFNNNICNEKNTGMPQGFEGKNLHSFRSIKYLHVEKHGDARGSRAKKNTSDALHRKSHISITSKLSIRYATLASTSTALPCHYMYACVVHLSPSDVLLLYTRAHPLPTPQCELPPEADAAENRLIHFFPDNVSHVGQIDQIDHDLDHLDPNLPLWEVVQDLHSTDQTQETRPTVRSSCRLLRLPPGSMS